jgi:5'-nucleotidase / UDP-sugar diphosphatase
MLHTIAGRTLVDLDGEKSRVRSRETNLGNLVTDAMLSRARPLGATVAIISGGAIRSSVPRGDFSLGQVLEVLPFGNYLMIIELSGKQITAALENGVSQVELAAGRFPQVAGMSYTWNSKNPPGSRIVSVQMKTGDSYQPLDPSAQYIIATSDFLAGGGDGYTAFKEAGNVYHTGFVDYEFLQDYIKAHSPLSTGLESRIIRVGE